MPGIVERISRVVGSMIVYCDTGGATWAPLGGGPGGGGGGTMWLDCVVNKFVVTLLHVGGSSQV